MLVTVSSDLKYIHAAAILLQVTWVEGDSASKSAITESLRLEFQDACGKLLGQLFDCNSRWKFAPPEVYHAAHIPMQSFQSEAKAVIQAMADGTDTELDSDSRVFQLLRCAPCLVPFQVSIGGFLRLQ